MFLNLIRLLNVIFAVLSVMPAILMLDSLNKERPFLKNGSKTINNILMLFYFVVVVGSTYNASLSLSLIFNHFPNTILTELVFNARNLVISISYMTISWGLFYLRKKS